MAMKTPLFPTPRRGDPAGLTLIKPPRLAIAGHFARSSSSAAAACGERPSPAASTTLQCVVTNGEAHAAEELAEELLVSVMPKIHAGRPGQKRQNPRQADLLFRVDPCSHAAAESPPRTCYCFFSTAGFPGLPASSVFNTSAPLAITKSVLLVNTT